MDKKESRLLYYTSGIVWFVALTGLIGLAGYYTGNEYREYQASKKLQSILGFLPGHSAVNINQYSRKINFYTVSQNTPNFSFNAFDADFKKCIMVSDSNGFITGGTELSLKKKPGVTRIFITGGSAAFGSIQGHNEIDDTYPAGTYCYEASIAGYLKKNLEEKFPDREFEIINAAVVQHLFHQNFAMYFEKIHDFKPDIIISMDGWNDAGLFLFSKHSGNPYQMTDRQSEEELTLELLSRYCSSYSAILDNLEKNERNKGDNKASVADLPFVDLKEFDYKKAEPLYIKNAQKLLWVYRSYLQQLRADSVYAIVALQPMLERRELNKKLSPLELKFRKIIEGNEFKGATTAFKNIVGRNDEIYFNGMGNERYNVVNFIDAYFFDKYFTEELGDLVKREGATYIDVGKEIENVGAEKEFFVDYCHMTPLGNRIIAGIFAQTISDYLVRGKEVKK